MAAKIKEHNGQWIVVCDECVSFVSARPFALYSDALARADRHDEILGHVYSEEFVWIDPAEVTVYGVQVNAVTDSMLWFIALVIDMEYTNGGVADVYWASQADELNDRDYALTVFEHVLSGGE